MTRNSGQTLKDPRFRRGRAIVFAAFAVGEVGSIMLALAGSDNGSWYITLALGVLFLAAVALMWAGSALGQLLAAIGLAALVLSLLMYGLFDALLNSAWSGTAFLLSSVTCLVMLSALVFAESVGDFLNYQRKPPIPVNDWLALTPSVGADLEPSKPEATRQTALRSEVHASVARAEAQSRLVDRLLVLLIAVAVALAGVGVAVWLGETVSAVREFESASQEMVREADSLLNALALIFTLGIGYAAASVATVIGAFFGVVLAYLLFLVVPFLLLLPVALPFALRWKRPVRMLLLRPFNRQTLTPSVLRMLRVGAARFGHIYTLADTIIRVAWYVRVPFVLGQISLFSFRVRKIRYPVHIHRLVRGLRRTWLRNLNWQFSRSKVFPVACDDAAWQAAVSRLVCETDLVLIDLTGATGNVIWELDQCERLGRLQRVVFLVETADQQRARRLIIDRLGTQAAIQRLVVYGHRETDAGEDLTRAIAARIVELGGPASFEPLPVPGTIGDPLHRRTLLWSSIAATALVLVAIVRSWLFGPLATIESTAILWPAPKGQRIAHIALGVQGDVWAVQADGGVLQVVNLSRNQVEGPRFSIGGQKISAVKITNQEVMIAAVPDGPRGPVTVWDGRSGQRVKTFFDPTGVFETSKVVRLSDDGRRLAIHWFGGPLEVWSLDSGHRLMHLPDYSGRNFAFGSRGMWLGATGGGGFQVWRISDPPELVHQAYMDGLSVDDIDFAPDNSALAVATHQGVWLWDLEQAAIAPRLVVKEDHGAREVDLGERAAPLVWRARGEVYVYRNGRRPLRLERPEAEGYYEHVYITDVILARDGKSVIGRSTDDSVVIWPLAQN